MSARNRSLGALVVLAIAVLVWLFGSIPGSERRQATVAPDAEPVSASGLGGEIERPPEARTNAASTSEETSQTPAEDAPAPPWDLIGRVEGLELPHDYAEVRVALWPSPIVPDCAMLAAASEHGPGVRLAGVAPDGAFRFAGLDADREYLLRAGGAAHVSVALESAVEAGSAPFVLGLARAKGLELELVGPEGAPPRTHADLLLPGSSFGGSLFMSPGALLEPWEEELAAVPGAGCGSLAPSGLARFVLSGPPELSALGPIECSFAPPGYRPLSRLLWADPVVERVPRVRVELEPTVEGWGSLEVELVGWSDSIRAAVGEQELLGLLELRYDDHTSLALPIRGPQLQRRLDGIPWGRAQAHFRSPWSYRWPRDGSTLSIEIGSRPSNFVADLAQAGAVFLREPDGTTRSAPLASFFVLRRRDAFGVSTLSARELPRLLAVVEQGPWELSLAGIGARGSGAEDDSRVEFDVEPGKLVELEVGALGTLSLRGG